MPDSIKVLYENLAFQLGQTKFQIIDVQKTIDYLKKTLDQIETRYKELKEEKIRLEKLYDEIKSKYKELKEENARVTAMPTIVNKKIKSDYLPGETENFYKTTINEFGKETILYLNYSAFNLNWIDELEIIPKVIFDVGCNNGGDSIRFKRKWKNAQVHAFEADPGINDKIKDYMKDEGIILSNIGVSDEDGERNFYSAKVASGRQVICGSGTFIESRAKDGDYRIIFSDPIKIKTISLHTYCQENNITEIDLLHIDVEGLELNVIKGLKNIRPKVIFAEQHPLILSPTQVNDFHTYMLEHNYQLGIKGKEGDDLLYIRGE